MAANARCTRLPQDQVRLDTARPRPVNAVSRPAVACRNGLRGQLGRLSPRAADGRTCTLARLQPEPHRRAPARVSGGSSTPYSSHLMPCRVSLERMPARDRSRACCHRAWPQLAPRLAA